MRLVCPECTAAYEVPDGVLGGAPRRVRCARCSHEWTFEPPAPDPVHIPAATPPEITVAPLPPEPDGAAPRRPDGRSDVEELEQMFADAQVAASAREDEDASMADEADTRAERVPLRADERSRVARDGGTRRRDVRTDPTPTEARRMSSLGITLAWLVTIVVLAAAAYAAVNQRTDVIKAWPASERAYQALGLE